MSNDCDDEGRRIESLIRQQRHAAERAGSRDVPVAPMSEEELETPVDLADPIDASHDPHVRLKGYTIIRRINLGGQASVYEAISEATGRKVAVKVITGGPYISSQSRARFEREVHILASLDHPGIVGIVDRGRTADGSFFLVMDFIEGSNLDDYLAAHYENLTQGRLIELFIKICSALIDAHGQGIIHRDIKPSNIRIDRHGDPHILDFGLAGLADDEFGRTITRSGNVIGSLPWTSPEQASGDVHNVGLSTDVYSLSVVLYHSLSGMFPYPVEGTLRQVTRSISKVIPSPLHKTIAPKFGSIDEILSAIVLKGLAKDPKHRYQSVFEFREELTRYLAGKPTLRPARIRKRRQSFLAVVSLVLLVALGYLYSAAREGNVGDAALVNLPHSFNSVGVEFVTVPSGEFWMGSIKAEPGHQGTEQRHRVKLTHSFRIATTEVTRAQYKQVMGKLPLGVPDQPDDLPVDYVSRQDAMEFCRKLSEMESKTYRLPTEAEWEYACRAGTMTPYSNAQTPYKIAWFNANSGGKLHPVKSLKPNPWGLFDMEGNAAEWCMDGFTSYLGTLSTIDPFEPLSSTATIRGGDASSDATTCRSAWRDQFPVDGRREFLGFRLVIGQNLPDK